jgi:hypothetical protein
MDQVSIKYTSIFHCKALQNLPKFGFLVWKQTTWQPWFYGIGRQNFGRPAKTRIEKSFLISPRACDDPKNDFEIKAAAGGRFF